MEDIVYWIDYRDEQCRPVERDLLGFSVRNKERLIGAIISNAFLNEKVEFNQLRQIPADTSLETMEISYWILSSSINLQQQALTHQRN